MAGLLSAGGVAPAEAATTYSAPLRSAVKSLPVATENNAGYDRDGQFGGWKDTDRDGQNTQAEVLLQETRATATYTTTRRCTVRGGEWMTSWDGRTHTSALNSAKGARGPEQWMPAKNRCGYVGEWVAVKIRWGLKVDSGEKSALTRLAASCPDVTLTVKRA